MALSSTVRTLENIPLVGHVIALGHVCANNKDKAERAALKATVGILLAIVNFPAEIIDEVTKSHLEKLPLKAFTPRPKWMRRFRTRTLRELCLPGSHQSGTYNVDKALKSVPLAKGWSRCQKYDVEQQLLVGIRCFDLRLMMFDGEVWLHHNLVVCVRLEEILKAIKAFVHENRSEIVLITMSNDGKKLDWKVCREVVEKHLYEKLVREYMCDMPIADIVDHGKNVVVFGIPDFEFSWKQIRYIWPNKAWPSELRDHLQMTLDDLDGQPRTELIWYKAECTPNTGMVTRSLGGLPGLIAARRGAEQKFDFVEELSQVVNRTVLDVLKDVRRLPFSVLCTDFIHEDIINRILEINENTEAGIGHPDDSFILSDEVDDVFTASPAGRINSTLSSVAGNSSFEFHLRRSQAVPFRETPM